MPMLVSRRLASVLCAGLLSTLPGAALATPVLHTVDASLSMLSANVSGTIALAVHTNLGTVNGTANANGTLSSTNESGSINLDWGSPVWANQLDVAAGDANLNTGPVGAVPGSATLDLFGFIPVNFNLSINVDFLSIAFNTPFSAPTTPIEGSPGAGPWIAGDLVDVGLGAQIDFTGTGPFGITIANNNIPIGPSNIAGIPIPLTLARDGLTGSDVTLTLPGLSLSLPAQPTSNFSSPGCEFGQTSLGCTLNVSSIDVTLTSLNFSNITGTLVASQDGVGIVPEPALALLLAAGLVGLGIAGRRRA
jgi:hypothetical protein